MPVQNQTSSSIVRIRRQFTVCMGPAAGQIVEWYPAEHGVLDSSEAEALTTAKEYMGEANQIVNAAVREWRVGFALNLRVESLSELAT